VHSGDTSGYYMPSYKWYDALHFMSGGHHDGFDR
jgi:hypothetical protein